MAIINKHSDHATSLRALNERRLVAYPSEKNFKMFIAHCFKNRYKRTELLVLLVDSYIDKLPESEKQESLFAYNEMIKKTKPKNPEDGD